jgi:hypothetical protein
LKIAAHADASFVLGKISFTVQLVLEHPEKRKNLVVLSVEVAPSNPFECIFSLNGFYFLLHSSNESLFMWIRELHNILVEPGFKWKSGMMELRFWCVCRCSYE